MTEDTAVNSRRGPRDNGGYWWDYGNPEPAFYGESQRVAWIPDEAEAVIRADERAKCEALLQRALDALEKADVDLNTNGRSYVNLETVRDLRAVLHQQGGQ